MKKLLIFLTLFLWAFYASAQNADYIFKNVNIISMNDDKILEKQHLVIKDGKILEIAPKTKYKSENTINAKGKYLMPTMAEAHIHFPKSKEDLEKAMKLYLINGVTKLRSMRGDWEDVERKEKYNIEGSYYPKLYLSPPVMHRNYDMSYDDLERYVKAAKAYDFDFIKILSIKDDETLKMLTELSEAYEIKLGGHFPVNPQGPEISDEVIFSDHYVFSKHLGGLIGESDKLEKRIAYIKNNNVFICPTLQWYAVGYGQYEIDEMLNWRGMEYLPDTLKTEWTANTKNYRAKLGKEGFAAERENYAVEMQERFDVVKRLNEEGVKLLLSPDSSSRYVVPGFGILQEMKLYQKAGLSNFDILKAATLNFALLFEENYGRIEVGAEADFILLSANPLEQLEALQEIEAIYFNQQFLNKEKLEGLRKSVLVE